MSEISRFTELETEVTIDKAKQKAKLYSTITGFIGSAILLLTALGLVAAGTGSYKLTTFALLAIALVLGPAFIIIFWLGVGTADIAQHFLPAALKGGQIETIKLVKHAASAIAICVALLLIAYVWNINENPMMFIVVIGILAIMAYSSFAWSFPKAVLLVILFMFIPLRNGIYLGPYIGTKLFLVFNTDWTQQQAAEEYQNAADERDVHDELASDMKKNSKARAIANSKNPGDMFVAAHITEARKSYAVRLGAEMVKAEMNGTILSSTPDMVIQADLPEGQLIRCHNVNTGKYDPCEFFAGNVIEGFGTITSSEVRLASNGQIARIGPNGLDDNRVGALPFVPTLPRFALIGHYVDAGGNQIGKSFVIGDSYTVTQHGYIAAMVNGDYYDCRANCDKNNPWPHDEWFPMHYRGTFGVRRVQ